MDRYSARIDLHGRTQRDREISRQKELYKRYALRNPSCNNVMRNGIPEKLVINTGTQPYYKKVSTLPDNELYAGDYIEWKDSFWLVKVADSDNNLYTDGEMTQCTYKLRWQNDKGEIIERWCTTQNASSYSTGTTGDKVIQIGYDQLKVDIPYDEETIQLRRGKRFLIDNNAVDPTPYVLSRIDTTSYVYNGHGYLSIIASEDQFIDTKDSIEDWLCNYKEENIKPEKGKSEIKTKAYSIKSGSKAGTTFTGLFYDENNEVTDIEPTWKLNCSFIDDLNITYDTNKIKISLDNDDLIGRHFTLILKDSDDLYEPTEQVIEIVGLY